MFLLLVRKRKCSRNKKRSFIWLCHRISFSPSEHFQGGKVVYKCYLYFRGKSDWRYSGLLIIRAGQRQQPGVTNRTLPLGGRDEQTEDNRNQLCWVAGLWCCSKSSIILTWKDWCWRWSSNTLATWCEELTRLKNPWSSIAGCSWKLSCHRFPRMGKGKEPGGRWFHSQKMMPNFRSRKEAASKASQLSRGHISGLHPPLPLASGPCCNAPQPFL